VFNLSRTLLIIGERKTGSVSYVLFVYICTGSVEGARTRGKHVDIEKNSIDCLTTKLYVINNILNLSF
jgi:hypothetical protein